MNVRALVAELLGTFVIVFVPVTASAYAASLPVAAIVSGLSVLAMIYALGPFSGAHFNPAVSLGLAVAKRYPRSSFLPYVLSQFVGGILAALACAALYGPGHGAHVPADPYAFTRNFGTEFMLTFFLMFVIMAVSTDAQASRHFPPVVVGVTVVMDVLIGGPITGGSMNPARSLGPALVNGGPALTNIWLYLVAPPIGAVAAGWLHENLTESAGVSAATPDESPNRAKEFGQSMELQRIFRRWFKG